MFTSAKWIWNASADGIDRYCDFLQNMHAEAGKRFTLRISSDSNYALYINDRLAAFGQYADYPFYKVADELDITDFLTAGDNTVAVVVWYYGAESLTYYPGKPGLIFEIDDGEAIVCASSPRTLSRPSRDCVSGMARYITGQLGFKFYYDSTKYDFWRTPGYDAASGGFTESILAQGISYDFTPRPVKKLILGEQAATDIVMQGTFKYKEPRSQEQADMQHAYLSFDRFFSIASGGDRSLSSPVTMRSDDGGDIFFIVDLREELCGFLSFDMELPFDCDMEIAYGEHLTDGRVRTEIRNFTANYRAKAGRNTYMNPYRRFGCRYIEFFIHAPEVKIYYAGLRPTDYPLSVKKFKCGSLLRETIYSVCVNTLRQCMHEHYEDCPWREQALYTMDSRNQMLCGYYAFGETEFPRASLKLISKGLRPDGLLSLCYPSSVNTTIPSFSLMYFVQMREYIDYTGDTSLAYECREVLDTIMNTFVSRITDDGLCANFCGAGGGYWNFYEWVPTMSGTFNDAEEKIQAPLNAFLSLALESMARICEYLGDADAANRYTGIKKKLNRAIASTFYIPEDGVFSTNVCGCRGSEYSVLTNALCALCGAAEGLDTEKIYKALASNGEACDGLRLIPSSLSMSCFRYDALLSADREGYKSIILDEIDSVYLYMLRHGATSFWETIKGEADFDEAGSLCHGWSALPIYYYELLLEQSV